jgi:hypothetical protein
VLDQALRGYLGHELVARPRPLAAVEYERKGQSILDLVGGGWPEGSIVRHGATLRQGVEQIKNSIGGETIRRAEMRRAGSATGPHDFCRR